MSCAIRRPLLSQWVPIRARVMEQAEVDNGQRPGITTKDQQRIAELEKENRELRRATRS
jgi:hypothetical protein